MNQSGKNWTPMHTPTTGIVRPQPSSNNYNKNASQNSFNLNTSIYPMTNLHQQIGSVQKGNAREFLQMNGNSLIQQQLIEDQIKQNQHSVKQRQFNEQKEKFCAFNSKDNEHSSNWSVSNKQNPSKRSGYSVTTVDSSSASSRKGPSTSRHPLPLPNWLVDPLLLPEVYKKAGGLVESLDGFVDTSRAYMLLMRTNIQPALLGVMWEMVNRTQPGRLKMKEFYGLLVLVALVQNGQTVPSADYLASIDQPICPVIDHPVLNVIDTPSGKLDSINGSKEKEVLTVLSTESTDLDEFADFVSAPNVAANLPSSTINSIPPSKSSSIENCVAVTNIITPVSKNVLNCSPDNIAKRFQSDVCLTNKGAVPAEVFDIPSISKSNIPIINSLFHKNENIVPLDSVQLNVSDLTSSSESVLISGSSSKPKNDKINLPILGASPQNSSLDSDDFSDFQSNISQKCVMETSKPKIPLAVDKSVDKYSVLRGIENNISHKVHTETCDFDADFGDFHSAQNMSSTISPQSNIFPKSPKVPLFEVDLQRTYSLDPFGEFDDGSILDRPISQINSVIICNNNKVEDEDDFGDFVSSDVTEKSLSNNLNFTGDSTAETQSVASLELPSFDANMSLNILPIDSILQDSAERLQPSTNICSHSSSLKESSNMNSMKLENIFPCNPSHLDHPVPQNLSLNSSTIQEAIPIADKYSLIRDDIDKEYQDPRNETLIKCLNGCNKILSVSAGLLESISANNDILREALATSQMQEYLSCLNEVWRVSQRILFSTRKVPICSEIEDLLKDNQTLWTSIVSISECRFDKMNDKDRETDGNNLCSVCLCQGGANLSYGGHKYHTQCANLWLNAVHAILPSMNVSTASI